MSCASWRSRSWRSIASCSPAQSRSLLAARRISRCTPRWRSSFRAVTSVRCASPCARPDDPGPSQPVRNPLHLCSPPAQVAMATQRLLRSIAPPSTGRAAAVETLADNDAKQRESAAIAAATAVASASAAAVAAAAATARRRAPRRRGRTRGGGALIEAGAGDRRRRVCLSKPGHRDRRRAVDV